MAMAEYGWGLSHELVKKARRELHEVPEHRADLLDAVRAQIETRADVNFLRTDDVFILRFLRARKFDICDAFRLYTRYFEYRQENSNLFRKFQAAEPSIKEALFDGLPGVLPHHDHFGRKILVLYSANWDNTRYGLAAIYRAILLTLEKLIDDEETQINGFVIIVDWSQFTFKQSTWLNPKILKLMIEGLQWQFTDYDPAVETECNYCGQWRAKLFGKAIPPINKLLIDFLKSLINDCFPARFGGIHFINQPWYIEAIFKMIKPFLKEKNRDKIFMHGINLTTLHQHIHKEVLPAELGGLEPPYNNQYWAKQLIGDENFSFGDKHIYWPNHGNFNPKFYNRLHHLMKPIVKDEAHLK